MIKIKRIINYLQERKAKKRITELDYLVRNLQNKLIQKEIIK